MWHRTQAVMMLSSPPLLNLVLVAAVGGVRDLPKVSDLVSDREVNCLQHLHVTGIHN